MLQLRKEPLYDVCQCFNDKLMKCPNYEVSEKMLFQNFYRALDQLNKVVVDNMVGGSLVKLSYNVAVTLLDQITKK